MQIGFNKRFENAQVWLIPGILCSICFLGHYPGLFAGFTNWDDPMYVTQNQYLQSLNWAGLKNIITEEVGSNHHPLTIFSLALDLRVAGMSPFPFHMTNLVLHTLCTFLVFLFVNRLLTGKRWIAFLAALVFAVHPTHVESVAWISARKDSLFAVFFLWGLISYLQFLEERKTKILIKIAFLFFLSVISKPTAITFPFVLISIDFFYKRKDYLNALLEKIPFFVLALSIGIITLIVQTKTGAASTENTLFYERCSIATVNLFEYIRMFFWPVNLSPSYPWIYLADQLPTYYYAFPVIFALLITLTILVYKKTSLPLFVLSFYFFTIMLTLQFIPVGWQIRADRYTYIPYLPLSIGLGLFLDFIFRMIYTSRFVYKLAVFSFLFSLSLGLTLMANDRSKIWKNSIKLWDDAIEKFPNNSIAYYNRGTQQLSEGRLLLATRDLGIATTLNPEHYESIVNLAIVFSRTGHDQNADETIEKAFQIEPDKHFGYYVKGTFFETKGQVDSALFYYKISVEKNKNYVLGLMAVGNLLLIKNSLEESEKYFNRVLAITPMYIPALEKMAAISKRKGNLSRSEDFLKKAARAREMNLGNLENNY